jgi:hypothetical protein
VSPRNMVNPELTIRLVCTDLPGTRFIDPYAQEPGVLEPVYLGIQKGKEVIETIPGDAKKAVFQPTFRVKRLEDGTVDFLGPFAQGKRGQRFVYLSWGVLTREGEFRMFRRAKIQLSPLTWKIVQAHITAGQPIVARLTLTDSKGCPLCATVKQPHIHWEF